MCRRHSQRPIDELCALGMGTSVTMVLVAASGYQRHGVPERNLFEPRVKRSRVPVSASRYLARTWKYFEIFEAFAY
jgi:hypothetical protein